MDALPSADLRSNRGTWAAGAPLLPALGSILRDLLPAEVYDPDFVGQELETSYFDTAGFALRKARNRSDRYLTLRVRCYAAAGWPEAYALSAKTEAEKFRVELPAADAEAILGGALPTWPATYLPANLQARLQELAGDAPLVAAVLIRCRRYAVEDDEDRYTLDVGVDTDLGKVLPFAVLEYKSVDPGRQPPGRLQALGLRPTKLSKFLWATKP